MTERSPVTVRVKHKTTEFETPKIEAHPDTAACTRTPTNVKLVTWVQTHLEGNGERGAHGTSPAPAANPRTCAAAQATHGPPSPAVRNPSHFPIGHKLS